MSNDDITLKDIHNDLRELLTWIKFSGIKEVKPALETSLGNDTKKLVYDLSDGSRGTRDIAKLIGSVSHMTVSNYWQEWERTGFGSYETINGANRFRRSFDLKDFGIKVPELKPETQSKQASKTKPVETEVESNDK